LDNKVFDINDAQCTYEDHSKDLFLFQACECLSWFFSCIYFSGDTGSQTIPHASSTHFIWLTNAE